MTRISIGVIAAALALSLSACDRPGDDKTSQQFGPASVAQAPDQERPYKDPSVPENPPENKPTQASSTK